VDRITKNYTKARDGEAYYYLGICQRFMGKDTEAYKNLYQATWSYAFHSAAYFQIAQIECSRASYNLALESLDRSLSTNANNNKARNLKSAVLRKLDDPSQALKVSTEMMEYDHLDFGARFENYLALNKLGKKQESVTVLSDLKTRMRGYIESYLELSLEYANAGLLDEAIDVLSNPGLKKDINETVSPMISYYLAYFWAKKGDAVKSSDYLSLASQASSDYCFPFRLEEISILESAIKANPSDAKAPYYLGNLLYDFQPESAVKLWETSAKIDNKFALVHRNLGYGYYKTYNDLPKSISSYEKAISLNNKDQRWFYELDLVYADARTDLLKRLKLLQDNHKVIANNNVVDGLSREILLLVQLGRYDKALEICNSRTFPQWEGVDKMYGSYLNAYLLNGYKNLKAGRYKAALKDGLTAMQYPDNMMVAREYRGGRECEVYYFVGEVYEKMGDHAKAMEYWNGGINLRQRDYISEILFYKAMCLKNTGKSEEAVKIFDGLINTGKAKIEREEVDFFEKFGERQTPDDRRADGHYLMGLGYLGKDKQKEASQEFSEAVRLNLNHIWANKYLSD